MDSNPINLEPVQPTSPIPSRRRWSVLVIIITILIVGVIAFAYYKHMQENTTSEDRSQLEQNSSQSAASDPGTNLSVEEKSTAKKVLLSFAEMLNRKDVESFKTWYTKYWNSSPAVDAQIMGSMEQMTGIFESVTASRLEQSDVIFEKKISSKGVPIIYVTYTVPDSIGSGTTANLTLEVGQVSNEWAFVGFTASNQ